MSMAATARSISFDVIVTAPATGAFAWPRGRAAADWQGRAVSAFIGEVEKGGMFGVGFQVGIACCMGLRLWSRALDDSQRRRVSSEDVTRGIRMAK